MRTLKTMGGSLALVGVLFAAGCGLMSDSSDDGDGGGDTGGDGDGEATALGEPGSVDTDTVVVEATYPISGYDGATVDVAINELRVRGDLAYLAFTVTPNDPEGTLPSRNNLYNIWGTWGLYPSFVDLENLNRHTVISDSGGNAMGPDVVGTFVDIDAPNTLSWVLAAPPEDVAAVDVYIDEYPPFTDVPVER